MVTIIRPRPSHARRPRFIATLLGFALIAAPVAMMVQAVTIAPASAVGFTVGNGTATYDPTASAATAFVVSTIAPGAVASTLSIVSSTTSGASADTSTGSVLYQPPAATSDAQSVVFQVCNAAGPCGPCPTPTASCGQGTIAYLSPVQVTDTAQVPIVGGYGSKSAYEGNNSPAVVRPGQTFSVSIAAAPQVVPSQQCQGALCATVNWLSNIVTISPIPAGEAYVPGSATFSGGGANTQGVMSVTYCTTSGQSGCTAQTGTAQGNTSGNCQPNNPCGGWTTTLPYLELTTGSTQYTPGTSLSFPTMTAQFTATGPAGTVIQPTLTEADVTANATFLVTTTATAYSWPTPANQFTASTTIKNDQTVSFTSTAPTNAVIGGPTYTPTASATSGLTPTITVDAVSASVCAINAGVVSFTAQGTCTLDANQAGDGANSPAPQVQQSFTVKGLPGAPTGVSGLPGNGSVAVKWTAPASNGSPAVTGYVVTPYIGASAQSAVTFNSTATTQSVTGLTNGTAYTFTVAAKNSSGTGPASAASAPVTPGTPSAPGFQGAAPGNASAKVAWTTPANNGSPITGYVITPYVGSVAGAPQVFNTTATSDVVTGLTNGTAYTFAIQAVNANGQGATAVTAPITVGTPSAPSFPGAAPGNGTARVAWIAPASNGSPITSYTITPYVGSTAGTPQVFNTATPMDVVTGLTNGTSYTFRVAATNAVGTGPTGATAAITVGAPAAPGFPSASPGNATAKVLYTVPAANAAALTGYIVTPVAGTTLLAPQTFLTPSANQLTVTGLTNGTSYTFRIAALNAIGTGPYSTTAAVVVGAPTAPGFPGAAPGNATARVSWLASTANASPITGYVITPYAGTTALAPQTFNSTALTETVTGLSNGVSYTFKVAGINALGTGPGAATTSAIKVGTPTSPGFPSAAPGNASAKVSWAASNGNGSAVTGYVITPVVGTTAQAPQTFNSTATTETVTGLTNGVTYTFRVAAINGVGTGPYATTAALKVGVPSAPTAVVAVGGAGQASLSWTAGADNGSAITGYVVTPIKAGVAQAPITFASTATNEIVTGLAGGSSYTFKVAAINGIGTGPVSAASNAVVPT